jgi:hypothetical protein
MKNKKCAHTVGKWLYAGDQLINDRGVLIAAIQMPSKLTSGTNCSSAIKRQKRRANGLLMAAAPDLLVALKDAIDEMEVNYVEFLGEDTATFKAVTRIIKRGRSAIARAESGDE